MGGEYPRRSRRAWPDEDPPAEPGVSAHVHKSLRRAITLQYGISVLLLVISALLALYVYRDHEYVMGRGQYRDAEVAQQEQRFREGMCDILDALPAGPVFDPLRAKYDCGPGLPVDALPPEQEQQMREFAASIPDAAETPDTTRGVTHSPRVSPLR